MEISETGIVAALRGRLFDVLAPDGTRVKCEVRQKVKRQRDNVTPVAVGDDVRFCRTQDDEGMQRGVIEEVAERRSAFFRPMTGLSHNKQVIAANLDRVAIVVAVKSPPLKTGLIDRCIIAARNGSLEPMLVMNKVDLGETEESATVSALYPRIGYRTINVSSRTGEGIEELKEELNGHRTLFAGHSGVGKSTLLNALIPGLDIRTQEISEYSNKGKHTTTAVELYQLPSGGFIVDSPGLKLMDLWEIEREELAAYFPEFEVFLGRCKYNPCSHVHEPNCAVKAAVEEGLISSIRYENYLSIYASL
jgi:ribosome biogenesis GTPase